MSIVDDVCCSCFVENGKFIGKTYHYNDGSKEIYVASCYYDESGHCHDVTLEEKISTLFHEAGHYFDSNLYSVKCGKSVSWVVCNKGESLEWFAMPPFTWSTMYGVPMTYDIIWKEASSIVEQIVDDHIEEFIELLDMVKDWE